jgi:hypothetical protein
MRVSWQVLFRAVCLVVIHDHRGVLRAVQVSPAAFWHDCGLIFGDAAEHIFDPSRTIDQAATE